MNKKIIKTLAQISFKSIFNHENRDKNGINLKIYNIMV